MYILSLIRLLLKNITLPLLPDPAFPARTPASGCELAIVSGMTSHVESSSKGAKDSLAMAVLHLQRRSLSNYI